MSLFYLGKRQIFVKSATEIFNDDELLNEFSVLDAALIGVYVGNTLRKKAKNYF